MPAPAEAQPNLRPASAEAQPNFISRDVEILGTVTFGKALTVHGKITGDVHASGTLTIGDTGVIDGNITAASISNHGTIKGNVTVRERCELKGASRLMGDLEAPKLIIEEGATFVGMSKVGPHPAGRA